MGPRRSNRRGSVTTNADTRGETAAINRQGRTATISCRRCPLNVLGWVAAQLTGLPTLQTAILGPPPHYFNVFVNDLRHLVFVDAGDLHVKRDWHRPLLVGRQWERRRDNSVLRPLPVQTNGESADLLLLRSVGDNRWTQSL